MARVIVFIDGHRFEVEIRDPRRWSRQAGKPGVEGRLNVAAPMPGKIVRLLVAEGDTRGRRPGLAGDGSHEDAERNESAESRTSCFAHGARGRNGGSGRSAGGDRVGASIQ